MNPLISFLFLGTIVAIHGAALPPGNAGDRTCVDAPLEIGIVLDSSTSISVDNFEKSRDFLKEFVELFDVGPTKTRFSLIPFARNVHTDIGFDLDTYNSMDELQDYLTNFKRIREGYTNTSGGINYMRSQLSKDKTRPGVQRIGVVLTDGNSQEPTKTADAATQALADGIKMIAVGVGSGVSMTELNRIAGQDPNAIFSVDDFSKLQSLLEPLKQHICPTPLPADEPSDESTCVDAPLEIGIVLDSSVSIPNADFTKGIEFLKQFVGLFDVSQSKTRFSFIAFAKSVHTDRAFGLDTYDSVEEVVKFLDNYERKTESYTNTSGGINYMRGQLAKDKVRPGVQRIGVVLTDGNSQEYRKTADAATQALAEGIKMIAVGVGNSVSMEELNRIAGQDPNAIFSVDDFSKLQSLLEPLKQHICPAAPLPADEPVKDDEETCVDAPLEIGIVLDSSTSISHANFEKSREFLKEFVGLFDVGPTKTRFSLIPFAKYIHPDSGFDLDTYSSLDEVQDYLANFKRVAETYTNTSAGINYMRSQLAKDKTRPGVKRIGVVLTDGNSQEPTKTAEAAKQALADGIKMIAVGVGSGVSMTELNRIAGQDPNAIFSVDDFSKLQSLLEPLRQHICPVRDERKCIDAPLEIGIVLDSSVSIPDADFKKGVEFLKQFVGLFDVSQSKTRFSFIAFAKSVHTDRAFGLDTYDSVEEVVKFLDNYQRKTESYTNTSGGINYMRGQLAKDKVRPGVQRVGVVLTDGNSQEYTKTADAAKQALAEGIKMIAVGVGNSVSTEELNRIAGQDPNAIFSVDDFSKLQSLLEPLKQHICPGDL